MCGLTPLTYNVASKLQTIDLFSNLIAISLLLIIGIKYKTKRKIHYMERLYFIKSNKSYTLFFFKEY